MEKLKTVDQNFSFKFFKNVRRNGLNTIKKEINLINFKPFFLKQLLLP